MSQEKLGESIGLTFQQVQKYERGSNRISAGTLFRLSQVLDVPISFFFDGISDDAPSRPGFAEGTPTYLAEDPISRRDARLLRLWRAAPPAIADEVLSLLSALSPQLSGPTEDESDDTDTTPTDEDPALLDTQEESDPSEPRQRRRRHGAIWDPADIYNTGRPRRK